ncbi:MAG: amidohydrolase family protein [Reichenbachiella sp.]|uniref:metal-dependent hydrolase family protein n=1 Tax=Reichenbachiella sp. TaxID=2184521 RepID=UPI00329A74D3
MKKIFTLITVCLFTVSLYAQTKLIKADAFLDVKKGQLVEPANILIEGELIKSINPGSIPDTVEVIDLSGQILLPGLMDMHVHLDINFENNYQYQLVTESGSKQTLRAAKNARKTLMSGFTTVRNIGQTHPTIELIDVALSEAEKNGWIEAPRIIPCGHMIGITGGHADLSMMGGFAEGILDTEPENGIADGKDEVLRAVRHQIKYGARGIKIMATAGVLSLEESVGTQQLTSEEMETIVGEAKRHHITVAAHAHGTEGIIAAVNAGVTSIEHGSILNDEAIKLMIEKGTYLVPTTGLMDIIPKGYDKMDPRLVEKGKYILPIAIKSHEKAVKAGVKIALGTDAPLIPHGMNAKELSALVERGMKPIEAIRSSTIVPAEMLNLTDRGEIKEGLLADIIAVESNPLKDVKALENVKFVMKGGNVYKNEK